MKSTLIICSGLPYSGKSWLLAQLRETEGFAEVSLVTMDEVRVALYGDRPDGNITMTEHVFKNQWLRYEILKRFVLGAPAVLTEAVMLTRRLHQRPMVALVKEASQYVATIEREAAVRDERAAELHSVELRVILCFASPQAVHARIDGSQEERVRSHASVHNLKSMRLAYDRFEFPNRSTYVPLYLDTSAGVNADNLEEVCAFIQGAPIDLQKNLTQKKAALDSFHQLHADIQSAN